MDDSDFIPATQVLEATQVLDATQKLESSIDSEPVSGPAQIGILEVDGEKHSVFTGDTVIGRGPACQIVIKSGSVSSRHAVIEATKTAQTIYDVDSTNGTNKGLIKLRPDIRYELKDGDELKFGDIFASWTTQIDQVDDALNTSNTSNLSESLFDNDETEYGTPMGPTRTPAPPDRFGTPRDFVPETPCVQARAFNTSDLCFAPASQSSPLPSGEVFKIPESPGDNLDDSSFICASQQPEMVRPLRPQTNSQFTITKPGEEVSTAAAAAVVSCPDSDEEEVDVTLAPPAQDVDQLLEAETQALANVPKPSGHIFDLETQPVVVGSSDVFEADTQAVGVNVFDADTQAVYSASETDDLLAAATQAVPHEEVEAEDMFAMCTQAVVPDRERGVSESDLMEAETQAVVHNDEDNIMSDSELFGAATQAPSSLAQDSQLMGAPLKVPVRSFRESMSDSQLMGAPTQTVSSYNKMNDSAMFEAATQAVLPSMSDSILMGAPTQSLASNKLNDSEFFGAATQAIAPTSNKLNDSEFFGAATQAIAPILSDSELMGAPTQPMTSSKISDAEIFGAATQAVVPSLSDSQLLVASTQAVNEKDMLDAETQPVAQLAPVSEGDLMAAPTQMVADVTSDSVFESETQPVTLETVETKQSIFTEETQAVEVGGREEDPTSTQVQEDILMGDTQVVPAPETPIDQHLLAAETQPIQPVAVNDNLDTSNDSEVLNSNDVEPEKEKNSDPNLNPEKVNEVINSAGNQDNNGDIDKSVRDERLPTDGKETEEIIQSDDLDISNDSEILDLNDESAQEEQDKEIIFQSEIKENVSEEQNDLLIADTQAMEPMDDAPVNEASNAIEPLQASESGGTSGVTENEDANINVPENDQSVSKHDTTDEDMFLMATQAPEFEEKAEDCNEISAVEADTQVPDMLQASLHTVNVNGHEEKEKDSVDDENDKLSNISDDLLDENAENHDLGATVSSSEAKVTETSPSLDSKVEKEECLNSQNKDQENLNDTTEMKLVLDDTTDEVTVDKTDTNCKVKENVSVKADDGDDSIVLSSQVSDPTKLSKTNYESVTMVKDDSVITSSQPSAPPKKLAETTYGTINMDQTEVVESPIIFANDESHKDNLAKVETVPNVDQDLELSEVASPIFISKKRSMSQSLSQSRMEDSARNSILEERERSISEVKDDQEEFEESFASNVSVTRRSKSTGGFGQDTSVTVAEDKVQKDVTEDPEEPEDETNETQSESDSSPLLPLTQTLIGADTGIDRDHEEEAVEPPSERENEETIKTDVPTINVAPVSVIQKVPLPEVKSATSSPQSTPQNSQGKAPEPTSGNSQNKSTPHNSQNKPTLSNSLSKSSTPRNSQKKPTLGNSQSKSIPRNSQNKAVESTPLNSQDESVDMGRGRRKRKPTAVMELSLEQEREEEEEKEANSPKKRRSSKVTPSKSTSQNDNHINGGTSTSGAEKDGNLNRDSKTSEKIADTQPWTENKEEVVHEDIADTQPWTGSDEPEENEEVLDDTQPLVIDEMKSKRVRKSTAKILEMEANKTRISSPVKVKTPLSERVTKKTKTPVIEKVKTPTTEITAKDLNVEKPVVIEKTKTPLTDNGIEDQSKSKRIRKATPKMLELSASKTQAISSKTPATSSKTPVSSIKTPATSVSSIKTPATSTITPANVSKTAVAPKRLVLASRASKSPVAAVATPVIVANSSVVSKSPSPHSKSSLATPVLSKSAIVKESSTLNISETMLGVETKPQVKSAPKRGASDVAAGNDVESPTKKLKTEVKATVEPEAQGGNKKLSLSRRGASRKLALSTSSTIQEHQEVPAVASKAKGRGRKSDVVPLEPEVRAPEPPPTPAQRRGKGKKLAMPDSLLINTPESAEKSSAVPSPVSGPTPVSNHVVVEPVRGRRGRAAVAEPKETKAAATKGRKGRQSVLVEPITEVVEPPIEPVKPAPAPRGRRGRQSTALEVPEPPVTEVPEQVPKGRRGRASVVPDIKEVETVKRGRKAAVVESVEPEKEKSEQEPAVPAVKGRRGRKPAETLKPEDSTEPDPEPSMKGRKGRPSKVPEKELEKEPEPVKATSRKGRGRGTKEVENEIAEDVSTGKGRSRAGKRKQDDDVEQPAKKTKTESKTASRKGASEVEPPVASPLLRRASVSSGGRSLSPSVRRGAGRHKVMFTGIAPDKKDLEMVAELGGDLTELCSDTTVLVTDQIKRTEKLLCAVARGVPVVSISWLHESKKSGSFLDPWQFIIQDTEKEKQWECNLIKTLQAARKQPLLKGLTIHVTKKVKPPPELFQQVIESGGGVYIKSLPKQSQEGLLVISCPEDKSSHSKLKKAGIPILDKEFILTGLFQRKLDYEFVV